MNELSLSVLILTNVIDIIFFNILFDINLRFLGNEIGPFFSTGSVTIIACEYEELPAYYLESRLKLYQCTG